MKRFSYNFVTVLHKEAGSDIRKVCTRSSKQAMKRQRRVKNVYAIVRNARWGGGSGLPMLARARERGNVLGRASEKYDPVALC